MLKRESLFSLLYQCLVFLIYSRWISDFRTFGQSALRTIGPSDNRPFRQSDLRTMEPSEYWYVIAQSSLIASNGPPHFVSRINFPLKSCRFSIPSLSTELESIKWSSWLLNVLSSNLIPYYQTSKARFKPKPIVKAYLRALRHMRGIAQILIVQWRSASIC